MEILSLILNLVLSGGLIVTLVTLKSTQKKAQEEAKAAELENHEKLLQNFHTYVLDPVKKDYATVREQLQESNVELSNLRKELGQTKRELYRIRRAVENIGACPHQEICPVKIDLEKKTNE